MFRVVSRTFTCFGYFVCAGLGSKDDPFPVVPGIRWKDAEPSSHNNSSSQKNNSKASRDTSRSVHLISEEEQDVPKHEDVHGPFFAGGSLIEGEDEELGNIGMYLHFTRRVHIFARTFTFMCITLLVLLRKQKRGSQEHFAILVGRRPRPSRQHDHQESHRHAK